MFQEERKDLIWDFYIKILIALSVILFLVISYILLTSNIF